MSVIKAAMIEIVNEIPDGEVTSYGAVAREVLKRTQKEVTAQLIGRMLSGLVEGEQLLLPRRRVVNKQGYISTLKLGERGLKQIALLEKENNIVLNGYISDPIWYENF